MNLTLLLLFLAFIAAFGVVIVESDPVFTTVTFSGWKPSAVTMITPGIIPSAVLMGRYFLIIGGSQAIYDGISINTWVEECLLFSIQALDLSSMTMFTPLMLVHNRSEDVESGNFEPSTLPLPPRESAVLFYPAAGTLNTVRIGLAAYVVGFCSMIPNGVVIGPMEDPKIILNFLRSLQVIRLMQEEFAPAEDLTLNISRTLFPSSVTPRFNATCVGNGLDTIYIIGGISFYTGEPLASVSQYNVLSGQFIDAGWPLGSKLIGPGVVEGSELLFLAGGYTRSGNVLKAYLGVSIFDPKALKFSDSVAQYSYKTLGWFTPQLFVYNRTLAVMGPTNGVFFDRQQVWFDVSDYSDNEMSSVEAGLPALRSGAVLAAIPGPDSVTIFLFGGQIPPPYGEGLSFDIFSGVMNVYDAHVPIDVLGFHYLAALRVGDDFSEEEKNIQREHAEFSRKEMVREKSYHLRSEVAQSESLPVVETFTDTLISELELFPNVTSHPSHNSTRTVSPSITYTEVPPAPTTAAPEPPPPDVPNDGENITIHVNGYRPLWYNFSFDVLLTESVAEACPEIQPNKTHSTRVSACLLRLSSSPNCNSPLLDMGNLTSLNAKPYRVQVVDPDTNAVGWKNYIAVGPIRLIGSLLHGILNISTSAAYPSVPSAAWSGMKTVWHTIKLNNGTNTTRPFYEQIFMYVCFSSGAVSLSACREANIRLQHAAAANNPCTSAFFKPLNANDPFVLSPVTNWVPFTTTKPPHPIPPVPHMNPSAIIAITTLCVVILSLVSYALVWIVRIQRRKRSSNMEAPLLGSDSEAIGAEDDEERGGFGRGAVLPAHQRCGLLDGKYRVLHRLGRGSFSVVYLVERVTDGCRFALKYVQCADDVDRLEAMRECEVAYSLQGHPNVIHLVDMFMSYRFDTNLHGERRGGSGSGSGSGSGLTSGEWNAREKSVILRVDSELDAAVRQRAVATTGERYLSLVMAYHEKGDLGKWIRQQKSEPMIPEGTIVSIAFQILSVMQFMHRRSPPIIHRDLKPENILLSSIGTDTSNTLRVTVTDFGLSRVMDKTFCETGVGSLPYVAPECWQRRYSTKVDIWAVGCIIYAACARRVESDNVKVMFSECGRPDFKKKLMEELTVVYGYSEALAAFIVYLLEPDPNRRPSAEEALRLIHKRQRNAVGVAPVVSTVSIYRGDDSSDQCVEDNEDKEEDNKDVTGSVTGSTRDAVSGTNSTTPAKVSLDTRTGSGLPVQLFDSSLDTIKTSPAQGDAGKRLARLRLQRLEAYFANLEEETTTCDFFIVRESPALIAALAQQQQQRQSVLTASTLAV